MRVYYVLGAVISPVMILLFRVYNTLFGTVRPRVLIVTESDEVLLVRSWTGHQGWELPGGGKGRHESSEEAAKREVEEELGIDISIYPFEYVGTLVTDGYKAPVFKVVIGKRLPIARHKWELNGAMWRSLSGLPKYLGPVARQVFENDVQNTHNLV